MDRNALDWLFSTAPQTIAAFVGLIFAGVCFIIGKIDDRVEKDSTWGITNIYYKCYSKVIFLQKYT